MQICHQTWSGVVNKGMRETVSHSLLPPLLTLDAFGLETSGLQPSWFVTFSLDRLPEAHPRGTFIQSCTWSHTLSVWE
uniref:Uncharacterized protein n=1 Tax=Anguilla anguilla TaxID=7936 RepID=A0A0E9REV4_ANGAN